MQQQHSHKRTKYKIKEHSKNYQGNTKRQGASHINRHRGHRLACIVGPFGPHHSIRLEHRNTDTPTKRSPKVESTSQPKGDRKRKGKGYAPKGKGEDINNDMRKQGIVEYHGVMIMYKDRHHI